MTFANACAWILFLGWMPIPGKSGLKARPFTAQAGGGGNLSPHATKAGPRGVVKHVGDVGQEGVDFRPFRAKAQSRWAFGVERVDVRERLLEGVAIKEQQGVEAFVLVGG